MLTGVTDQLGDLALVGADVLPGLFCELNSGVRKISIRVDWSDDAVADHSRNDRAREIRFYFVESETAGLSFRILAFGPQRSEELITIPNRHAMEWRRPSLVGLANDRCKRDGHRALIARELLDDFANAR